MNGEFDFGSQYVDYQIARDIEKANAPRSRAERRRAKKQRRPAADSKWVTRTIHALFILLGVWLALLVIGQWIE